MFPYSKYLFSLFVPLPFPPLLHGLMGVSSCEASLQCSLQTIWAPGGETRASGVWLCFYRLMGVSGMGCLWWCFVAPSKSSLDLHLQLVGVISRHCCSLVGFLLFIALTFCRTFHTYGREIYLLKSLKVQIKIKQTSRHNSVFVIPKPSYLSLNSWDISQSMSEWGEKLILYGKKREERIKAQSQECPKNGFAWFMQLLPFCHHITSKKNNQTTKQIHKLCGYSAFEQSKQHVWSLQPGCQDIRKAEILSLGS